MKMIENPYQPPKVGPADLATPVHRSFRLTPSSSSAGTSAVSGTMRQAIVFTLVQQVPLLLLSAMLLDGGLVFKRVVIAAIAFWILTLISVIRRGSNVPDSDVLLVKWGYLPLLFVTCILWLVVPTIVS